MNPRSDMYPCNLCNRKLATKEAYQAHIAKCDGRGYHNRGRKPADNTCMVSCSSGKEKEIDPVQAWVNKG